jgi:hypothetical protein
LGCPLNRAAQKTVGTICDASSLECAMTPANKVAFSGVGSYVMSTGSRVPRTVLYRVDVEDCREPGLTGPMPDRYRIRMWVLTAAELTRLNNPSDRLLSFRQSIAASDASTMTVDGSNVPLGSAAFGVRAPDVDDGGTLVDGNVLITPSQRHCQ